MEERNSLKSNAKKEPDRMDNFVKLVFDRINKNDKAFIARLRSADNPQRDHESWKILAAFGVDLTLDHERSSFALIGSAICRSNQKSDGPWDFGAALSSACGDPEKGESRLRRLLACRDTMELCRVLRHLISFVQSNSNENEREICYAQLLRDIYFFGRNPDNQEKIKRRWAQQFYHPYLRKKDEKDAKNGGAQNGNG